MSETNNGTHIGLTADGRAIYVPVDAVDLVEAIPDGGAKIWLRDPSPLDFAIVDQDPAYVMLMLNQVK